MKRIWWIAFVPAGRIVLSLLAIRPPMQAQAGKYGVPGHHERLHDQDGNVFRAPYIGLDLNARITSSPPSDTDAITESIKAVPTSSTVAQGLHFAQTCCIDSHHNPIPLFESLTPEPETEPDADRPGEDSKTSAVVLVRNSKPVDFHQSIYDKNRLEFSLDGGWLPINIPFVFDVFLGDAYTMTNLKYTLVPIVASVRWQMDDVGGPWIFRGNWDLTASLGVTVIPRGPETHYIAWIMGIRRNFVPHHGRIAPYFDGRLGLGRIDAKAPLGVLYAQGQNFTFTMNMGSGVRYNFNPRYSISAGLNWMHISNLYLSQPKFANYGINVYGPMFGIDVQLGRPHRHASE